MHSTCFRSTLLRVFKFLQIKQWWSSLWGKTILQKVWIIWSPLLYFHFISFKYPISSSFIRFKYILHDSGVLFLVFWNFYKSKREDLISGGHQFWRMSELFGLPRCIWIFKVLWTQIFGHSLDFNAFGMIEEYFSESLQISGN